MPFGGGGALHAGALMREVGLNAALVPRFPGITCALGCVIADLRHDQVQTVNLVLDGLDAALLDSPPRRRPAARRAPSWRTPASPSSASTRSSSSTCIISARRTPSQVRLPVELDGEAAPVDEADRARRLRGRLPSAVQPPFARRARSASSRFAPPPSAAARISISRRSRRRRGLAGRRGVGTRRVWFDGDGARPRSARGSILPVGARVAAPPSSSSPTRPPSSTPACRRGRRLGNLIVDAERGMNRRSSIPHGSSDLRPAERFLASQRRLWPRGARRGRIAALPERVKPFAEPCARGGLIVPTHFTLVPGRGGEPLISPHLKALRPFLGKGRFRAGRLGPGDCRRSRSRPISRSRKSPIPPST